MNIKLSLVIPAYNESDLIADTITEIKEFLADQKMTDTTEVIVVTAESADGTPAIVAKEIKKLKHHQHVQPGPKVGKGRDVAAGVAAAKGEYIIFSDADLATPLHHIPEMLKLLEHNDVVIGRRNLTQIHEGFRYYTSVLSNVLIQLVILPGFFDTQCGFKGFKFDAATVIFNRRRMNGWGFDMEILKIAREQKMSIAKMKIDDWFDPKGDEGLVGESPMSANLRTLGELWRIRVNSWMRRYK